MGQRISKEVEKENLRNKKKDTNGIGGLRDHSTHKAVLALWDKS